MLSEPLTTAAFELRRPIHLRVRELLRKLILEQFEDGQKFYSERELVEKLNHSQPTIRRALVDLAAEGHLVATPRRGFFVRRRGEQRHVGLFLPYVEDASEMLIESVAEACGSQEISLHIYYIQPGDSMEKMIGRIGHKQIDERIILTGFSTQIALEFDQRLRGIGYKSVVIGGVPKTFAGSAVSLDHGTEAKTVLDYLSGLGHRRMVFLVNEPRELLTTNRRALAIEAELKEKNFDEAELIFCNTRMGNSSFNAAYDYTGKIMARPVRPTAIVPLSGVGSWAVLRYMVERKISVPEEMSIFCFDPVIGTPMLPIPLTGFHYSQRERASMAIELLWDDEAQSVHRFIKPELVIRSSVGPAAGS